MKIVHMNACFRYGMSPFICSNSQIRLSTDVWCVFRKLLVKSSTSFSFTPTGLQIQERGTRPRLSELSWSKPLRVQVAVGRPCLRLVGRLARHIVHNRGGWSLRCFWGSKRSRFAKMLWIHVIGNGGIVEMRMGQSECMYIWIFSIWINKVML